MATVEPWTTVKAGRSSAEIWPMSSVTPWTTAAPGSSGVESTLCAMRRDGVPGCGEGKMRMISVNVPPVSTPTIASALLGRNAIPATSRGLDPQPVARLEAELHLGIEFLPWPAAPAEQVAARSADCRRRGRRAVRLRSVSKWHRKAAALRSHGPGRRRPSSDPHRPSRRIP